MAFSEFRTLEDAQNHYQIEYTECNFVIGQDLPVAESFAQQLAFRKEYIDTLASEAARCELIIAPLITRSL